jgi:hypothetical protein
VRSIIMGEAGRAEIRSDARASSPQFQLMRRTTGTEPPSVFHSLIQPLKPTLCSGHVCNRCAAFLVLGGSMARKSVASKSFMFSEVRGYAALRPQLRRHLLQKSRPSILASPLESKSGSV